MTDPRFDIAAAQREIAEKKARVQEGHRRFILSRRRVSQRRWMLIGIVIGVTVSNLMDWLIW